MSDSLTSKTYAIFSRPANRKIVSGLRAAQNEVIEFPFAEAEKIELSPAEESLIERVAEFDWIIFPDVYAVEFFLEALDGVNQELFELDLLRILAVGEAVADRLRFVQVHADVIPARADAESVFSALRDYLYGEEEFKNLRFLLPKESSSRTALTEMLRRNESEAAELNVYRLKTENAAGLTKLKALLKGGAVDEFVFTAPVEASGLTALFGEKLKELLAGTSVSATDETTFQTLREHELRPLYFKQN
ncbi:MAG: uroporphyrinogen-III synthase [Acidobacteriota bacterium]|nr:uroporphyrinogen-III synthase [Acidobacteriota bacterium]